MAIFCTRSLLLKQSYVFGARILIAALVILLSAGAPGNASIDDAPVYPTRRSDQAALDSSCCNILNAFILRSMPSPSSA